MAKTDLNYKILTIVIIIILAISVIQIFSSTFQTTTSNETYIYFSDNCTDNETEWSIGWNGTTKGLSVVDGTWFDPEDTTVGGLYYNLSSPSTNYNSFNLTSNWSITYKTRTNMSGVYNNWVNSNLGLTQGEPLSTDDFYFHTDWFEFFIRWNNTQFWKNTTDPDIVWDNKSGDYIIEICYNCTADNKFTVKVNGTLQQPIYSEPLILTNDMQINLIGLRSVWHSASNMMGYDWIVFEDNTVEREIEEEQEVTGTSRALLLLIPIIIAVLVLIYIVKKYKE